MAYKIEKINNLYRIFSEYEPQITVGYESNLEDAELRVKELENDEIRNKRSI